MYVMKKETNKKLNRIGSMNSHTKKNKLYDDYPYYNTIYEFNKETVSVLLNNFTTNELILTSLNKMPFITKNLAKYKTQYFVIMDEWSRHYELNKLTDYFTEKIRVKCKFKNNMSAVEFWNQNKPKIKKEAIQLFGDSSALSLREIIYKHIHL